MATKEICISVTAEDIANGERNDCTACPIALAMNRTGLRHVSARNVFVVWWDRDLSETGEGNRFCAFTPSEAADFMSAFDAGENVEPFEFTLTVEGSP